MKRLKLVVIVLLVLSLTGCVKKYAATENQTGAVAEYMAGLLLESDRNYDKNLISMDETKEDSSDTVSITQTPTPTQTQSSNTSGIIGSNGEPVNDAGNMNESSEITNEPSDNANESLTLTQLIADKDFEINYKSYKLADTYPEDSDDAMFVLTHSEGYKLLVISFSIKNDSNKKQTLNLMDDNINYQLDVNSGTHYSPLLPLLENDLRYIDMKFEGGKTKKGLLIFEVSEKSEISDIKLIATKGNETATVVMK